MTSVDFSGAKPDQATSESTRQSLELFLDSKPEVHTSHRKQCIVSVRPQGWRPLPEVKISAIFKVHSGFFLLPHFFIDYLTLSLGNCHKNEKKYLAANYFVAIPKNAAYSKNKFIIFLNLPHNINYVVLWFHRVNPFLLAACNVPCWKF